MAEKSVLPTHHQTQKRSRNHGRGCCCCLCSFLLKLIFSIVVIIGLAIFLFWLIVRPQEVKVHVTEATLRQWNYTSTNDTFSTLNYDLALNISIRNPNRRIGVYFNTMELRGLFEKNWIFESRFIQPFYQGHRSTTLLTPHFKRQEVFLRFDTTAYNEQRRRGVYKIGMDIYVRVRFKLGKLKTESLKPRFSCEMEIPLTNSNGTPMVAGAAPFRRTKCDLHW